MSEIFKVTPGNEFCLRGGERVSISRSSPGAAFSQAQGAEFLAAQRYGAQTRFTLAVTDDEGTPVSDAWVEVLLCMLDADKNHWVKGKTDERGRFVVEGKTGGNEISIGVQKEGYYKSRFELCYVDMDSPRTVRDGKWLPWASEERVVLRRIENPVELKNVETTVNVPHTNAFFGFDIESADWVKPYGKGEYADLCFNMNSDGKVVPDCEWFSCQIVITNRMCGAYVAHRQLQSSFKSIYRADTNAVYRGGFDYRRKLEGGRWVCEELGADEELILRTRSVFDALGNPVSYKYARLDKIEFGSNGREGGCAIRLRCSFNPTPNDANLEDAEGARMARRHYRIW